jgi:hypothetical protein
VNLTAPGVKLTVPILPTIIITSFHTDKPIDGDSGRGVIVVDTIHGARYVVSGSAGPPV